MRDSSRRGRESEQNQANSHAAAAALLNADWKFDMNEFELEDFPQETKNIFQGKELDNNPVLWIRVDPDMEFLRKVKVVQEKRNNWLFQLLREQDVVGQIEAIEQLPKYNEDLVYEILKTVSRNENFFYKVRKHALLAMHRMEVSAFNKYLSHEAFLVKSFNQRNFDEITGFYKENNFADLLHYYLDRSLLKAISKCKEQKLKLTDDAESKMEDLKGKLENPSATENAIEKEIDEDKKEEEMLQQQSTMIQINFADNQMSGMRA